MLVAISVENTLQREDLVVACSDPGAEAEVFEVAAASPNLAIRCEGIDFGEIAS